jgi:hypothetical protein
MLSQKQANGQRRGKGTALESGYSQTISKRRNCVKSALWQIPKKKILRACCVPASFDEKISTRVRCDLEPGRYGAVSYRNRPPVRIPALTSSP